MSGDRRLEGVVVVPPLPPSPPPDLLADLGQAEKAPSLAPIEKPSPTLPRDDSSSELAAQEAAEAAR